MKTLLSNRLKKTFIYLLLLLICLAETNLLNAGSIAPAEAKSLIREVNKLVKQKKIEGALDLIKEAEKKHPQEGYYPYFLGETLLYRTDRKDQALQAFKRAQERKYASGLLYHRIGMCYFHLQQDDQAIQSFRKAIKWNEREKAEALEKNDQRTLRLINHQIADSYVWLTKEYNKLGDFVSYFEAAKTGLTYEPNNQWLPRIYSESLQMAGNVAFGQGDYDRALEIYQQAQERGVKWKQLPEMISLVKKRRQLGNIQPVDIHRFLVVNVTQGELLKSSGEIERLPGVSEGDKKRLQISADLMKQVIEVFSDGKWSVAFTYLDTTTSYREKAQLRASHPDHLDFGEYLFWHENEIDTVITHTNIYSENFGKGHFGGTTRYPYINALTYGQPRGMLFLRKAATMTTLLHEFFHTIENMAQISPKHGFTEKTRYPGWPGGTEMAYYQWHFQHTLPHKGWQNLNYRKRYPAQTSQTGFRNLSTIYQGIPLIQRQKANALVYQAKQIGKRDPEKAIKIYLHSLELSPYQSQALSQVISYGIRTGWDDARLKPYSAKLDLIRSVSEFYIELGFYRYLTELEEGIEVGSWNPKIISTSFRELSWDISDKLDGPGTYAVTMLYNGGQAAVTIDWVGIFNQNQEIAKDRHRGWSGNSKRNIVYYLSLPTLEKGTRYSIKSRLKGEGKNDSRGIVLLRKTESL